ncbi:AAA family ATPase [Actinomycetospora cinnamomea]|uniref:Regulatory LuxR family protein n=1 Tax=Actinomycetospora cinnamomea TaxID=663609 RepID=A0A2U1FM09_9PSEU|nr:LuxR family transcriptional regulator [Actinomycetospora cinnamomea]PVZ13204.1 regulatory LuxR family protein [Actinomycetospora cinnamomea]
MPVTTAGAARETAILEREHELAVLETVVGAAVGGRGGLAWIEGPPGIGKTRLLAAARARADGRAVLAARGGRLERDFAFGVVRGLFEPLLVARGDALLTGAARLAAPALAPGRVSGGEVDAAGTLHGVYWLVANLAEQGPVLLVVDDAHLADTASLRALAYLARRVAELPVAIVLAAQAPDAHLEPAVVDALREAEVTTVLRPGPLSPAAVGALAAARCGSAPPGFVRACHEATAGNPLLVRALLAAVLEAGAAPGPEAVAEQAPAVVARFVARRLRDAGGDAAAVADAVAVLGGAAELRHVAAVSGLDPDRVTRAAETLVAARLLCPGRPLTLAHSLVEQAVADRLGPAARHRAHRRAADVLAADGAGGERVAAHLLHTEAFGDPTVVAWLRRAGREALAKGAPETARAYLQRAVAEPPPPEERAAVLHELGAATARVSHTDGVALLDEAFATATHPRLRGLVALDLARALQATLAFPRALEVLDEARAGLDDGSEAALELAAAAAGLARRDPARRAEAVRLTHALRREGRLPARGGAILLATTALEALQTDHDTTAVDMAREALAATLREPVPDPAVVLPATTVLVAIDHLDPVRAAAETMLAGARRRGSTVDFTAASVLRTQTRYLQGDLVEAEADARLADALAVEHGLHTARRYTLGWLVVVLVERGAVEEAAAVLAAGEGHTGLAYLLAARGRLRLAQGRAAEARDDFAACGERLRLRGMAHPNLLPWRTGLAAALHRLGDEEAAVRAADDAVATGRRYGSPRALADALRTRGLVGGTIAPLREAVTLLEPTPARLELARARVDLGAALRRGNQRVAARTELAAGQDLARRCGADPLVERAREELGAAGARPRRMAVTGADSLTAAERRVADLAADGLSNREVAQALFVTAKTVETHLGHVYRKLGVTGRDELLDALRE